MAELVREAEPIIFDVVKQISNEGIKFKAQGEDKAGYFNAAELIAMTYAKEFKKEGLLELVTKYKQYTQEMCKE